MTWKTALTAALKGRRRRDIFRAGFVAAPVAVICSFEKGIGTGLLLAAGVAAAAAFIFDLVVDARKARKEASRVSN